MKRNEETEAEGGLIHNDREGHHPSTYSSFRVIFIQDSPDSLQRKVATLRWKNEGWVYWPSSAPLLSRCLTIALCFKKSSQGYAKSPDTAGRGSGSGSSSRICCAWLGVSHFLSLCFQVYWPQVRSSPKSNNKSLGERSESKCHWPLDHRNELICFKLSVQITTWVRIVQVGFF